MARWELTTAHQLWVPDTEWEQVEINRDTGKQARRRHKVPLYVEEGTIVCNDPARAHRGDVIFTEADGSPGKPTPDMKPLDDEAQAISDEMAPGWTHAIESLPGNGNFGEALLDKLERSIDALASKVAAPVAQAGAPTAEEFAALQEQVAKLMAEKAENGRRL